MPAAAITDRTDYLDYSRRDDVSSGGVKLIPSRHGSSRPRSTR